MRAVCITMTLLLIAASAWAQGAPRIQMQTPPAAEHVRPLPEGQDLSQVTPEDLGWGANDKAYPNHIAIHKPDGVAMVWVPAGSFTMGEQGDETLPLPDELKPPHPVEITHGFWISRTEISMQQYADFLNAIGRHLTPDDQTFINTSSATIHNPMDFELEDGVYSAPEGEESLPALGISWFGADAYARHCGGRLPTEAEWEYAARGPDGNSFPWGMMWQTEYCCNAFHHGGGDGPAAPMPVGACREGASWCAAINMVGNVAEWCRDWYAADYYSVSPESNPPGPTSGEQRVVRGGSCKGNMAQHAWRASTRQAIRPESTNTTLHLVGLRPIIVPGDDPFGEKPTLIRPQVRPPRLQVR